MHKLSDKQLALGAAVGAVLLWAFAFPASKAMLAFFSFEQIVLLRYLVASGFFCILLIATHKPLPRARDALIMFLLGGLGVTVYQLLFVVGIGRVSSGAAAMIITANPVFVSLLAYWFLREKLSRAIWFGIGLSLIGVAMVTFGDGIGGQLIGYLMLVAAVIAIACYFVFQKPLFARHSPLAITAYTNIAGTVPLLYFLPQSLTAASNAPPSALFIIVGMGIFSSGFGFLLWTYALSKQRAGIVTSTLFLQPLFVTVLAWAWLGELPSLAAFIGGAVILLGLALILWPRGAG